MKKKKKTLIEKSWGKYIFELKKMFKNIKNNNWHWVLKVLVYVVAIIIFTGPTIFMWVIKTFEPEIKKIKQGYLFTIAFYFESTISRNIFCKIGSMRFAIISCPRSFG